MELQHTNSLANVQNFAGGIAKERPLLEIQVIYDTGMYYIYDWPKPVQQWEREIYRGPANKFQRHE